MSDVAIKSQEEKDEFAEDRAWLEELLNDSPLPLFFIESRKRGRGGMPKCVLSNCGELIRGADYRVRVGTIEFNTNSGYIVVPASPEMVWTFRSLIPIQGGEYHVKCFELAAALFDVRYLNRISLVIRDRRDLCPEILSQICVSEDDKRYLDGGAMRLAISWLSNRLHEVAAQEWLDSLPKNTVNGEIWRHAGSAKFRKDIIPDNLKDSSLVTKLAPFESDGEGDTEEWNMHTQYWSLFLGQALGQWSYDKYVVTAQADRRKRNNLSNEQLSRYSMLSEKAIRGIWRLATAVDQPNDQDGTPGEPVSDCASEDQAQDFVGGA